MTRPGRRGSFAIATLLLGVLIAGTGCALVDQPRVLVRNETTVPVAVDVDGTWIGTVAPGAIAELPFPLSDGQMTIQAKTPTGASIADLLGTRAMFDAAVEGSSGMSSWQDLACGRVVLAVGPFDESLLGPAPSPTGSCP